MLKSRIVMLIMVAIFNKATTTTQHSNEFHYDEFLNTETAIIDTLRSFVTEFEEKIRLIKTKTLQIKDIHTEALKDVDKYVSNPLKALTILKRFASDWNLLHKMASNVLSKTDEMAKDRDAMKTTLKFPSDVDFDEAVGNLLRLQNIYKLEPNRISLGEINGVKFGPQMSWSDCLEIGRKSDGNGDFQIAKFWIETALKKLPTVSLPSAESHINSTDNPIKNVEVKNNEILKARYEIMEALFYAEYHIRNYEKALEITKEMLLLKPEKIKSIIKVQNSIENKLKKESKKSKIQRLKRTQKKLIPKVGDTKKTAETLLIEEICRTSTIAPDRMVTSDANSNKCFLVNGNLLELQLQPSKMEIISIDPYIAIHHDVIREKQIENLKNLIEKTTTTSPDGNDEDNEVELQFTNLGQRKLQRFNGKLQSYTGHSYASFGAWQPQKQTFNGETMLPDTYKTSTVTAKQREITAHVLISLQTAKVGGSVIFPQLDLSLQVPKGSLLYWSNLNEFQEVDYRIKHHVCPVISGTQIAATTTIRRV